ncbi:MAG: Lrp/AsnC family transcriptional regulator [Candidatus Omnitrophica bacterium]|nr:Lrp/AsnC family transcriptional regulator [Candidatus Omnitrophota bacterium]
MLNKKEKILLEELQNNFPLRSRPFLDLAKRLNLKEKDLIKKIRVLKNRGIIRYIGAVFDLKKIGLKSSLIALSVKKKGLNRVVKIINSYPEITHNYLRSDKFNLWATISANSNQKILEIIRDIKKKTKIKNILNLKTIKVFKIDARFKIP